jgi:hypothetical protein
VDILVKIFIAIVSLVYNIFLVYLFILFFKSKNYLTLKLKKLFMLLIFASCLIWGSFTVSSFFIRSDLSVLLKNVGEAESNSSGYYSQALHQVMDQYSLFFDSLRLIGYCCDIIILSLLVNFIRAWVVNAKKSIQ